MAADAPATEPPVLLCLRSEEEGSTMLEALAARGLRGQPLEVLTYREIWQDSSGALAAVRRADERLLVVLTSRRGVAAWASLCAAAGRSVSAFEVAAVGGATAAAAAEAGFPVAFVGNADAAALADELLASPRPARRALFAVAREAALEPADRLRAAGWEVTRLETYVAAPAHDLAAALARLRPVAFAGVVATSPNRAEHLLAALDEAAANRMRALPWFVIGERTADRVRTLGVTRITVASGASMAALVDAAASVLAPSFPGESP